MSMISSCEVAVACSPGSELAVAIEVSLSWPRIKDGHVCTQESLVGSLHTYVEHIRTSHTYIALNLNFVGQYNIQLCIVGHTTRCANSTHKFLFHLINFLILVSVFNILRNK